MAQLILCANAGHKRKRGFIRCLPAVFIIFLCIGGILKGEDLFNGDIYLAGTNKGVLIFRQRNRFEKKGDITVLTHTYTHPDGSIATVEEVTLRKGSFEKYEVDFKKSTCGCLLERDGDTIRFGFTRGDVNRKGEAKYASTLVMGPTLTRFVHSRWDRLLRGETVFFYFPAMTLQRIVRFQMSRNDASPYNREGVMVVKMDIANVFLRLLVDPVDLVYDLRSKRILEIHGKSLLEREVNGRIENPIVNIYYRY
jgi:hypothetical protein